MNSSNRAMLSFQKIKKIEFHKPKTIGKPFNFQMQKSQIIQKICISLPTIFRNFSINLLEHENHQSMKQIKRFIASLDSRLR
jgi:hypothetical protein